MRASVFMLFILLSSCASKTETWTITSSFEPQVEGTCHGKTALSDCISKGNTQCSEAFSVDKVSDIESKFQCN